MRKTYFFSGTGNPQDDLNGLILEFLQPVVHEMNYIPIEKWTFAIAMYN